MRFQQLKRNPNNIIRKKLVKSKKKWIVISSLAFSGGLLFLGGPTTVVKADTTQTSNIPTATATIPTTTTTPAIHATETNTAPDTSVPKSSKPSETTTPKKAAISTDQVETKPVDSKSTEDIKQPEKSGIPKPTTSTPTDTTETVSKPDTAKPVIPDSDVSTTSAIKPDTPKPKAATPKSTDPTSPTDPTKPTTDVATKPENTTPEPTLDKDGHIASGVQGTSNWYISKDKTLHIGSGNLGNSKSVVISTVNYHHSSTSITTNNSEETDSEISTDSDDLDNTEINVISPNAVHSTSTWIDHAKNIDSITIDGDVTAAPDMQYVFADLKNLKTIQNIDRIHTKDVKDMEGLFMNDQSLVSATTSTAADSSTSQTVDLSSWNVSGVENVKNMFMNDHKVVNIKFNSSGQNTIKHVKDFSYMFKNDDNLTFADSNNPFLNWNLNYAEIFNGMFQNDTSLRHLNLFGFLADNPRVNSNGQIEYPDTGDSSKNEGMFDGTNLESITFGTLSHILRFSNKTALPSSKSNYWVAKNGSNFLAMPNKDGGGLGSVFVRDGNVPAPTGNLSITYTPDATRPITTVGNLIFHINSNVPIPNNENDVHLHDSNIGETIPVSVPSVVGYTPDRHYVNAFVVGEGKVVSNDTVIYTGNKVPAFEIKAQLHDQNSFENIQISTNKDGKPIRVGDNFTFSPHVNGYVTSDGDGVVTVSKDGNYSFTINHQASYTPVVSHAHDITFTASETDKNSTKTVSIPEGNFDIHDQFVGVPKIPGYNLNSDSPKKLQVIYGADGISTVKGLNNVKYTPIFIPDSEKIITADKNQQKIKLRIPGGKYGTTNTLDVTRPGYKTNVDKVTVSYTTDGKAILSTEPTYEPVYTAAQTIHFETPNGKHSTFLTTEGTYYQNSIKIAVPEFHGYNRAKDILTMDFDANGKGYFSIPDNLYTPKTVDLNVNFTLPDKSQKTITASNLTYDASDKTITVPTITGYNPNFNTLPITFEDGKASVDTTKITYSPVETKAHNTTITSPDSNQKDGSINIPDIKYGEQVDVTVPNFADYIPNSPKVKVSFDKDGHSQVILPKDFYKPVHTDAHSINFTAPNNQTASSTMEAIDYGTKGSVKVPDIHGYTHAKYPTLPITFDETGHAIIKQPTDLYQPIHTPKTEITFTSPDHQSVTSTMDPIDYGNDNGHVPVPDIPGYSHEKYPYLPVTFNPDTALAEVKKPIDLYQPITLPAKNITFTSPNNHSQSSSIKQAIYGSDDVTVAVPHFNGYTNKQDTLKVNFTNGQEVVNIPKDLYSPVTSSITLHFTSPDGRQTEDRTVDNIKFNQDVYIKVPNFIGYVPNHSQIKVHFDPQSGKAIADTKDIVFKGVDTPATTATITTSTGQKITVHVPKGQVGQEVTVTVPDIPGFTHKLKQITGLINSDGKFVSQDAVEYIRIPSLPIKPSVTTEKISQSLAALAEEPNVHIFQLTSNNEMTQLDTNLNSNWDSTEKITIDGVVYYRVGDNAWIKATEVYPYQTASLHIRTYDNSDEQFFNDQNDPIKGQILPANSDWLSDRTVTIDGKKYYRVANNKFIRASEAYIYQPIKTTLRVKTNIHTYDVKGNLITDQNLVANSTWSSDSIVYIKGEKFFRIATNKFVKASDVIEN